MRRYLLLSVLGICMLVFASASSAVAAGPTYYAGKNAQSQKLLFTVDHTTTGPMFDPIFINQISRCPVTGQKIQVEFSFQGFQVPIRGGKVKLTLNDLSDLFRWSGTVTSKGASGTEAIDIAAFDSQGGLQDCGAGSVPWKAQALVPASSAATAPAAVYFVRVTKARDGSVSFSVTH